MSNPRKSILDDLVEEYHKEQLAPVKDIIAQFKQVATAGKEEGAQEIRARILEAWAASMNGVTMSEIATLLDNNRWVRPAIFLRRLGAILEEKP